MCLDVKAEFDLGFPLLMQTLPLIHWAEQHDDSHSPVDPQPCVCKTFWTLSGKGRVSVEMSQQPCLTFHAFSAFPSVFISFATPPASFPVSTSSEELISQPGWGRSKQKITVRFCSLWPQRVRAPPLFLFSSWSSWSLSLSENKTSKQPLCVVSLTKTPQKASLIRAKCNFEF